MKTNKLLPAPLIRTSRVFRAFSILLIVSLLGLPASTLAQSKLPKYEPLDGEVTEEGAWKNIRTDSILVAIREVNLVAKAETKPALSVTLLPDSFNAKSGNAALFYLQAMSWAEQTYARSKRDEFDRKYQKEATEKGLSLSDFPPHSWRERTRPEDLPLDEVKQYLSYSYFQTRHLKEAALRTKCDFDRRIREVDNPVMYLLPEVQSMRGLARTQSLRFLTAIAENKNEEAVEIFGQQLAMATHLCQEPFLVSNLVGIACASIGWYDSLYLCEQENAPNLYWAVASLPKPLADLGPSLAYERNFLFEQAKMLRDVDMTPRSNLYWSRFVDEFSVAVKDLAMDDTFSRFGKFGSATAIAAGYPGAMRYLLEAEGMDKETLDTLPRTQVFFLGVRKYYERARDEMFKWQYVSYADQAKASDKSEERFNKEIEKYGLVTAPAGFVLPAVKAAMAANARLQQSIALLQTVESIRNHMAQNENQLPSALAELELPAPNDPATNQPFNYVRHDQGASLYGEKWPGYRVQLELRVAN